MGVLAPPGVARRASWGCENLCQIVAKFIILYKFTQYIKWCKGHKNDFSFRTGCGLHNESRTAALKRGVHADRQNIDCKAKRVYCANAVERAHTNSLDANDKLMQTRHHVRNTNTSRKRQFVMRRGKYAVDV